MLRLFATIVLTPWVVAPIAFLCLAGTGATAQSAPSAELQIAGAVTPLPATMRAGATVLGYDASLKLVPLRKGTNGMICLADDPKQPQFHPACYHESMEPFMARGRELRAQGMKGEQVDSVRFAEAKSGKITLPTQPASLYQIFAPDGSFNPATGVVTGGEALFVAYIPYATEQSTGITAKPQKAGPWLMFPGTPKAHIMLSEKM